MNIKLKAKKFAIKVHSNQFRKGEPDKPMIIHPINVACILSEYGFDDNVVAAGYLHDVVEDTKYTLNDITKIFGNDISSLVESASEPDKSLSWEERKIHTINECSKLDLRHKAIIVADKINNLSDLERLINTSENYNYSNFKRGYNEQKWYYTTLYEKISKNETHPIFDKLKHIIKNVFENDPAEYKYLTKERLCKLKEIHYLKYEIKNLINTLDMKPYVIEFTGTPRTGKTSIIKNLEEFFKKGGYKVCILEEFTTSKYYKEKIYPTLKNEYRKVVNTEIPKHVYEQLVNALKKDYDIIIIDRSLFDRCIWIDRLHLQNGIDNDDLNEYFNKYIPIIRQNIDMVVATYSDSKTSMIRDYEANLSLEKRNFLNEKNLEEYNISLQNMLKLFKDNEYNINFYDTTSLSLKDNEYLIVKDILLKMKNKYYNEFIKKYKKTR